MFIVKVIDTVTRAAFAVVLGLVLFVLFVFASIASASGGYLRASMAERAVAQYAEQHVEQEHATGGFGRCRRRYTVRALDCWAGYENAHDNIGSGTFYERVTVRMRRGRITVTSVMYDEPPFVAHVQ